MNIAFFANDKKREQDLAEAFIAGVEKRGDKGFVFKTIENDARFPVPWPDVVAMVGVKSRDRYRECQDKGIHTIMLDKSYQRHGGWEWWRCAINAHHPTATLMDINRPRDRMADVELSDWRKPTKRGHIVIAGSSAKYHRFYDLPEPTKWATDLVAEIRKHTDRPIIYRPKPSWHDAVPIDGTSYSKLPDTIGDVLKGAHALVTHGSNACFEAVVAGVPCIILGDGVAKPISSTDIADIERPYLAPNYDRQRWLAALSYCQWTLEEFKSGEAWAEIRPQIGA